MCLIGMSISYSYAGNLEDGQSAYDKNDYKTAYDFFLIEANKGDAKAQYNLGVMFAKGQGVLPDYKEAVKWYRLAAEQGDAEAQNNLGFMYNNGRGVTPDYKEAVKWYQLAAGKGIAMAKCALAGLYAEGLGITKDLSTAKRLAKEGVDAGEQDCEKVWKKYNLADY